MIVAAGVLILTPDNQALFLMRGPGGDHAGEFCFPGGKVEDGETLEECAARETKEETDFTPGNLTFWTRQITNVPTAESGVHGGILASSYPNSPPPPESPSASPPSGVLSPSVDFTTFILRVKQKFEPKLDGEHEGYVWASIDKPPQPLHPGCLVALDRIRMDELGIAEAIRDNRLTSPQRYENVTLFALRITGTGVSYRSKDDEFVLRDKALYLNERFLRRCGGLPVIWVHPKKNLLDSKEFADRIIGAVMFAYIVGEEVWGIARIYDDDAIEAMKAEQLSTSPAVAFHNISGNRKIEFDTGEKLLIEGDPILLDHLAVVERGVWDKGKDPAGVLLTGDYEVTEEEKKAAEAKADAEARAKADAAAGEKLDKLLSGLDSISKRMDAYDAKMDSMSTRMDAFDEKKEKKEEEKEEKKDAEEEEAKEVKAKADKKKADAEEEEKKKDKEKADAEAKVKADNEATAARIAELEKRIPLQLTDADYASMAQAQERADSVFQAFGDSAPRPLSGETPLAYRKRIAGKLKEHSATWKPVNLSVFADEEAFKVAETQIYADAVSAANHPKDLPTGTLRAVPRRDVTGRTITSFYGEPKTWMASFGASNPRRLTGIRQKNG